MTRLLMVTTVPNTLGFLLPFTHHFLNLGWKVDALSANSPVDRVYIEPFNQFWTVEWSRNPLALHNFRQTVRRIRKVVLLGKYDIVHVHTPIAAFITRYALREMRQTGHPVIIYTAHGFHFHDRGHPLTNSVFLGLEMLGGRWTDYLVVINREDEAAARRYHIVPSERICYMPGIGVDQEFYHPDRETSGEVARVREELGLAPGNRLFLMVGEFLANKRHKDALHALALLNRSEVHLVCAGQGPLLEPMCQLADDLGLRERVHFLGFRRDIPALIRAASAALQISQREGLPRSVIESLCLGVAVIGTNTRGTRDLIGAGGGLIVNVGDVEGLTRAMAWILDNPERARALGQQGRAQMQGYALHRIIALHEELYARALTFTPIPAVPAR